MHSFCSGGEGTRTRDTKFWLQLSLKKKFQVLHEFYVSVHLQKLWPVLIVDLDQSLTTSKFIYLFIYLLFSHNKDYTSITLYKDVARGPQKTTRLVRGGPLVTIILSNRTITTHNNGQYKTHYRYSRKSKTFVLNDCNVKIEVTEFGKEFQILGPWNNWKSEASKMYFKSFLLNTLKLQNIYRSNCIAYLKTG